MSSGLLSSRADMMPELTNREIMIQEHQKKLLDERKYPFSQNYELQIVRSH